LVQCLHRFDQEGPMMDSGAHAALLHQLGADGAELLKHYGEALRLRYLRAPF
jgi:hypothetical protein